MASEETVAERLKEHGAERQEGDDWGGLDAEGVGFELCLTPIPTQFLVGG